MSVAEIKKAIEELTPEQQRQVSAFLVHLGLSRDSEWRSEMTRLIDDKDPAHWVSSDVLNEEPDKE